jgi:hypothetical protein
LTARPGDERRERFRQRPGDAVTAELPVHLGGADAREGEKSRVEVARDLEDELLAVEF